MSIGYRYKKLPCMTSHYVTHGSQNWVGSIIPLSSSLLDFLYLDFYSLDITCSLESVLSRS